MWSTLGRVWIFTRKMCDSNNNPGRGVRMTRGGKGGTFGSGWSDCPTCITQRDYQNRELKKPRNPGDNVDLTKITVGDAISVKI